MPDQKPTLLRIGDVVQRVGISRSTVYRMVRQGVFPTPCRPAGAAVALWSSTEIDSWVQAQLNRRACA